MCDENRRFAPDGGEERRGIDPEPVREALECAELR